MMQTRSIVPDLCPGVQEGDDPARGSKTSLQKRTDETPSAQRVTKMNRAYVMDAWRSLRVRDALWNPPLQTLRRCGDITLFVVDIIKI
jgi:hypothetical protein